jgi:hypothetical protein
MRINNVTFRSHFSGGASAASTHYLWASRRSALPIQVSYFERKLISVKPSW